MMPFIDLAAQQRRIKPQIDAAIEKVLGHGIYINGPEVKELESALCEFVGAKHCIGVSNGTDALIAALQAYDIGPGDAIITSPFTFFATVESILFLGATPVFADINPTTFNICADEIRYAIAKVHQNPGLNLRGIMPVDLFGLCADYDSINAIAKEHDLFVIQDAAQAFGARTPDGKMAPTHGDIGTTSFFPAKPLGCYGDGGAIFTDNDQLADKLRSIRVHGKGSDKYDNIRVGQNCRLDTIQAAILKEKLSIYASEVEARNLVAENYRKAIAELNQSLDEPVMTSPSIPDGFESVWAQYTTRQQNRSEVMAQLKAQQIPSVVYYRKPLHLVEACGHLGYQTGDFPNAELASAEVLSFPFHPYLTPEQIAHVTTSVKPSTV